MHTVPGRYGKGSPADGAEGLEQGSAVRTFDRNARRLDLRAGAGRAQPVVERHQIFSGRGRLGHRSRRTTTEACRGDRDMSDAITFTIDDKMVHATADETIWQVANRTGLTIPHLCYAPEPGYRPDGNCRACMVEIEGERVLQASCLRKPTAGMKVHVETERAKASRRMVFELLMADQPARAVTHDPDSKFWQWADRLELSDSRFPAGQRPGPDRSHPAMAVNLDACINCTLCVRACREVQVNDVIGMAGRGVHSKIVFDLDDPMGESTCVACGECVQACPTGALMPATVIDDQQVRTGWEDREVDSLCPFCGVGCQLTYKIKD